MKQKFVLAYVLFAMFTGSLLAVPCGTFPDAEANLRKIWPKSYPGEKVESVAPNGDASKYDKAEASGKEFIDEYGNKWEWVDNVSYCRIPAKVTVTRSNGSKVQFNVSAIYRQNGKSYKFTTIGVSGSEEVASSGQEAPSKDEIKKLITSLWLELHADHKVEKVAVSAPELKKDSSKGRWWYNVGADIYILNEDGVKQKCVNDYTTVFKGEPEKEGVNPSGPWKVSFLDDPTCN